MSRTYFFFSLFSFFFFFFWRRWGWLHKIVYCTMCFIFLIFYFLFSILFIKFRNIMICFTFAYFSLLIFFFYVLLFFAAFHLYTNSTERETDEILSVRYEDGRWSKPYYDCGGANIWMLTYTVPFFGYENGSYFFK